ncbi:MAG: hypothetical protein AAFX06_33445 [Planctomycetota bacterium]
MLGFNDHHGRQTPHQEIADRLAVAIKFPHHAATSFVRHLKRSENMSGIGIPRPSRDTT